MVKQTKSSPKTQATVLNYKIALCFYIVKLALLTATPESSGISLKPWEFRKDLTSVTAKHLAACRC